MDRSATGYGQKFSESLAFCQKIIPPSRHLSLAETSESSYSCTSRSTKTRIKFQTQKGASAVQFNWSLYGGLAPQKLLFRSALIELFANIVDKLEAMECFDEF